MGEEFVEQETEEVVDQEVDLDAVQEDGQQETNETEETVSTEEAPEENPPTIEWKPDWLQSIVRRDEPEQVQETSSTPPPEPPDLKGSIFEDDADKLEAIIEQRVAAALEQHGRQFKDVNERLDYIATQETESAVYQTAEHVANNIIPFFEKDEAFVTNEKVRENTQRVIGQFTEKAVYEARENGNMTWLKMMHDPRFNEAARAMGRIFSDYKEVSKKPVKIEGEHSGTSAKNMKSPSGAKGDMKAFEEARKEFPELTLKDWQDSLEYKSDVAYDDE
jgi:hypothetical protein